MKTINKQIAVISSLLLTIAFWYLIKIGRLDVGKLDKLVEVSINIAGVLLGFLITLQGILISIKSSQVIKVLKQAGKLTEITDKMKKAVLGSSLLLLYCLILLVFDISKLTGCATRSWEFLGWAFLQVFMLITSYRFISDFIAIMAFEDRQKQDG
jgi:hypothetical protein